MLGEHKKIHDSKLFHFYSVCIAYQRRLSFSISAQQIFFSAFPFFPPFWLSGFPALPTFQLSSFPIVLAIHRSFWSLRTKERGKGEAHRLLLKKSPNNLSVLCVIWNSVFLCKKRHVQTKNEPLDLLNICFLPGPIFSMFPTFIFAIGFLHLSEWTGVVLLDNKQCKEFFEKDFRS